MGLTELAFKSLTFSGHLFLVRTCLQFGKQIRIFILLFYSTTPGIPFEKERNVRFFYQGYKNVRGEKESACAKM